MKKSLKKLYSDDSGFTLVEAIIVILVLSIMAMVVAPRIGTFMSDSRNNFKIMTGMITKTFDDSFLHNRINYLAVHLSEGKLEEDISDDTEKNEIFSRDNGLSVLNLEEGKFIDSKRKILKYRKFNEYFRITEVVLSTGEVISEGTVLIPFYPQGYSDNSIIHILVNDEEKWSIKNFKHMKEPAVIEDYITFEEENY